MYYYLNEYGDVYLVQNATSEEEVYEFLAENLVSYEDREGVIADLRALGDEEPTAKDIVYFLAGEMREIGKVEFTNGIKAFVGFGG